MKTLNDTAARLDVDELFHLALRASQQNRHEDSIRYLKQVLEIDLNSSKAHYMLGAEHAEIGMYDRAVDDMSKAVALDPNLMTAHFQLGLLHITAGRVEEAVKAWKPLDALGGENFLYLFKSGMLHLTKDEFAECVADLEQGIALNKMNEALNNDMRRIVEDAKQHTKTPPPSSTATNPSKHSKTASKTGHVLLSAYRNKDDKE